MGKPTGQRSIRVAELFAGVGGFRLGLEGWSGDATAPDTLEAAGPFQTVWANQWEPPGTPSRQFAARCYQSHFGSDSLINRDVAEVMNQFEAGKLEIPPIDLVVGGFPCQDYSVAKPLSFSGGIEGKKGVLWWEIHRFLQAKKPRMVLLENVDRLLSSPAAQRGRDFAVILSAMSRAGYSVSWRVINAAEYGFPQRRKRVFIYAQRQANWDINTELTKGVLGESFPCHPAGSMQSFTLAPDPYDVSRGFGRGQKTTPFQNAGIMQNFQVHTLKVTANYSGNTAVLRDILVEESEIPESYWIAQTQVPRWEYLKGAKREQRVNKTTGYEYFYSEGAMSFPDSLEKPSRTILTGEGGASPSRFKHVVAAANGKYRRLVPDELDQLQGFPRGWTNTGMSDGNRAFCMGNALVVGVVNRIGRAIAQRVKSGLITLETPGNQNEKAYPIAV